MSTNATGGLGTKLSVLTTVSPATWTLIAEVTSNVDTPTADRPRYEATHMQSTAKEFISSRLADNGEVAYECNYDASNTMHQSILDDTDTKDFKIEMFEDDGTTAIDTVTFSGFFSKPAVTNPLDGIKKLKFSIVVSGAAVHDYAGA